MMDLELKRDLQDLIDFLDHRAPKNKHTKGGHPYHHKCHTALVYWLIKRITCEPMSFRAVAKKFPGLSHSTLSRRYRMWKNSGLLPIVWQRLIKHLNDYTER